MAEGRIEFTKENLQTPEGINQLNRMFRLLFDRIPGDLETVGDFSGYGIPEEVITAGIGSTYRQLDGGADTTLYVKESGTGNTGWIAK